MARGQQRPRWAPGSRPRQVAAADRSAVPVTRPQLAGTYCRSPCRDSPEQGRSRCRSAAQDEPITLSTHETGAGPAVVFCHGFPDSPSAGDTSSLAVADGRLPRHRAGPAGLWGEQRAPAEVADYGLAELTGDLVRSARRPRHRAAPSSSATTGAASWPGRCRCCTPTACSASPACARRTCPSRAWRTTSRSSGERSIASTWPGSRSPAWPRRRWTPTVTPILTRIFRSGVPLEEMLEFALADGRLNMNPFKDAEAWPLLGEPLGAAGAISTTTARCSSSQAFGAGSTGTATSIATPPSTPTSGSPSRHPLSDADRGVRPRPAAGVRGPHGAVGRRPRPGTISSASDTGSSRRFPRW